MKKVLVTGASGFIGRHLVVALRRKGYDVRELGRNATPDDWQHAVSDIDIAFHLAGINRTTRESQFQEGNAELTRRLCRDLEATGRATPLVLSSSSQADSGETAYGRSKRDAESAVKAYQKATGAPVYIYRLCNVFGKWSRPNYNTVVATFCHNLSRGLPVTVTDRSAALRFVHVDDVVASFLRNAETNDCETPEAFLEAGPIRNITLGELHDLLASFQRDRKTFVLPDLSDPLIKCLHSTFLSFVETKDLANPVEMKQDNRGWLFELIKSPHVGQIFVSTTKAGVTRGNHYHDRKVEKFCVIQGRGIIRFRQVGQSAVFEYPVDDMKIQVVDIPPGYTHSITNIGETDMITLFWANEIFDASAPDTYFLPVHAD
ncbi:MAG: NAD-dependent epimerase/dehydratase family protein [Verrucomicrobiales bacterium]